MAEIRTGPDGKKLWVECTQVGTRTQRDWDVTGRGTDPVATPPGSEETTTSLRLCQDFEIRQRKERPVAVSDCVYYEAVPIGGNGKWGWIVAIIVGFALVGAGVALLATAGVAGAAGAAFVAGATTQGVVGGSMALAGASALTITAIYWISQPTGESVGDYERGKQVGADQIETPAGPWAPAGPPEKVLAGAPHPC